MQRIIAGIDGTEPMIVCGSNETEVACSTETYRRAERAGFAITIIAQVIIGSDSTAPLPNNKITPLEIDPFETRDLDGAWRINLHLAVHRVSR